jgi:hypothetical protein
MKLLAATITSIIGFSTYAADEFIVKTTLSPADIASLTQLLNQSDVVDLNRPAPSLYESKKMCHVVSGTCYLPEPRFPQIEFNVQTAKASEPSQLVGKLLDEYYPRAWKGIHRYSNFRVRRFAKEVTPPDAPFRFVVQLDVSFESPAKNSDARNAPVTVSQSVVFFGDFRDDTGNGPSLAINSYYPMQDGPGLSDSGDGAYVTLWNPPFHRSTADLKLMEKIEQAHAVERILAVSGSYAPNLFEMQTTLSSSDFH